MTLNPRSLALQGVGYGALFIALQGFAPYVDQLPQTGGGGGQVALAKYEHDQEIELKLQQQIAQEDEIIILAIAQMAVHGVFG